MESSPACVHDDGLPPQNKIMNLNTNTVILAPRLVRPVGCQSLPLNGATVLFPSGRFEGLTVAPYFTFIKI